MILFAVSFLGLCVLFVCKHLEETRGMRTPLSSLRRRGDWLVTDGWVSWTARVSRHTHELFVSSFSFFKDAAHDVAAQLHRGLHSFSVWFGEYLKRRNARKERGAASVYVKNMLEYKQKIQTDADTHADKHMDERG